MSVAIFPNLRCPRNGTADEIWCLYILVSALAHIPLKACSSGRSQGLLCQPGYRPTSESSRNATFISQVPAGKRVACTNVRVIPSMFPRLVAPCALPSVLCLALFASIATPALGQNQLSPVIVTGSREPEPLDRATADVVVIDANTIRGTTADSIESLLRLEAGVQVSRSGGPGQSAGVFIRGASASNTVVLVDGVRIGSATLGQVEFESISLSQVERIEILRGPGSSLYGADAVGGVIQIFTKRGEGVPRFVADLAVGGFGSLQGGLGVSGAQAGFDYAASVGHEHSRGVSALKPGDQFGNFNPDDDGYTRNTGQFKFGFTPAAGHRVGLNVVESRLNAQYDGSYAQNALLDFRNKLSTSVVSLDYRGVINSAWTMTTQLAHNDDDLRSGATVIERFRTQRDQFTWQNAWRLNVDHQVVFAYEYLNEKAASTSYSSDVKRDNKAAVLGYTGQFGAQVLQADVRHDRNSVHGNNTTGRLGWSMEVAPDLRARALAGTTFRAPSFNDLFYPGYGVATITPERGRSVELGLVWRAGGSEASATVYQNRVHDMIGYEPDKTMCPPDISYQFGCARNISRARLQGATISGSHRWGAFHISGTFDLLDAKDVDTGKRLIRRAAHQESLAADYDVGAWNLGASVLAVGARPDGTATLASYETLDLRARWRFAPQWQFEAKVLNITNRKIEPIRDYQTPGRQAWIGVRFDSKSF